MPHDHKPVSPCIVHRDPTSPKPRRSSLSKPSGSPKLQKDNTVPLRSCCEGCITVTEECTRVGEAWKVKFTSGARRKIRRASMNDARSALTFEKIKVDEVPRKNLAAGPSREGEPSNADMDRTLFPLPSPPPLSPSHIARSEFPWASSGSAIADSPGELGVLDNVQPLGRKPQPDREINGSITHLDPIFEAATPIVSRCTSPFPHGVSEIEKNNGASASPGRPASPSSDAIPALPALQGSGFEAPVNPVQEHSAVLPSTPSPITASTNFPSQYLAQMHLGEHSPPPLVSSPSSTSPELDSEKHYAPPSTPKDIGSGSPRLPSKVKRTSFSGSIFRTGAGILKGVSSTMGGVSV